MFLYVTDKIKTYHKIGIAENVHDRLNTFKTLIPDLDLALYIPLPNRQMGELIERTLKDHLKVFRLKKSECYGLNIESIRKIITGYTLLMNYCVIDYNINVKDHPYELSQNHLRIELLIMICVSRFYYTGPFLQTKVLYRSNLSYVLPFHGEQY